SSKHRNLSLQKNREPEPTEEQREHRNLSRPKNREKAQKPEPTEEQRDSAIMLDIKQGLSLPAVSRPQPEQSIYISKNDLKSPEKIMDHLTDYGLTGDRGVKVKSVRLVTARFPRNRLANTCDRLLQTYAETALEMRYDKGIPLKDLEYYCGIVIEEAPIYT
ncbi:hypothetical protein LINGRAHAP2_LOCUS37032, partial [Linum grandiflorum]